MKNLLSKTCAIVLAGFTFGTAVAADDTPVKPVKDVKPIVSAATKKIDESKLSPFSIQVMRLVQAGIDEKVIVAFVKNNAPSKGPSAEELIYLHEFGVSAPVLAGLVDPPKEPAADLSAGSSPVKTEGPAPTPYVDSTPPAQQPPSQVVVSTPLPTPPTVVYTQPAPTPIIVETPAPYYPTYPTFSFGFGLGHHFGSHHGGHFGHHGGHPVGGGHHSGGHH